MTQLGLESRIKRNPLVVTQSDIASFKADRRDWFLGSYLGLRPKGRTVIGPLALGTRVHSALEMHYGQGFDLENAYVSICEQELEDLHNSGVVFNEKAWRSEAELGRIMLAGYAEWLEETGVDQHLEVINAEEKLSHVIDVEGTPVELRGKIDLRAKDTFTGMNLVIDWKTTANMAGLIAAAPTSEQLLTYMTLERMVNKDKPEYYLQGARFVMLRKVKRSTYNVKPPFYDFTEVHHGTKRLQNFWTQLYGVLRDYVYVVNALDAGVDFRMLCYPNPAVNHRWSDFKAVNEMIDDGARVEAMIADLYDQQDPHARYNVDPVSLLDYVDDGSFR